MVAIERALAVKDKYQFAGLGLWVAGFDVHDRYWINQLENADRAQRRASRLTRALVAAVENASPNMTFGDAVTPIAGLSGILAKMDRRLDPAETARGINVMVEIANGDFDQFDPVASDRDLIRTPDLFRMAFDFEKGADDEILGARLRLGDALEGALRLISQSQAGLKIADFTRAEILGARDDVRNALKIAICLHDGLRWIYGEPAFGLRLAGYFARTLPGTSILGLTLGFARLRRLENDFYSSNQIAQMADRAELTWLMSVYLRELHRSRPDLQNLIGPERMKLGFSSSHEHQKHLKELSAYDFPKAEFRPWETWQKLSKRTMSSGLLVMSIGSPEKVSTEALLAGVSVNEAH